MRTSTFRKYGLYLATAACMSALAIGWLNASATRRFATLPGSQYSAAVTAYSLRSNSVVTHPQSGKIFASIPSGTDPRGNSIVRIDPATGTIEQSIWVGSEPNKLALSNDGNTLYVGLDGARAVRKIDLENGIAGQQFQAGFSTSDGPLRMVDFAISPTDSNLVAVSRDAEASSGSRGVAIFDNGLQRINSGGSSEGLAFTDSESILFGSTFSPNGLQKFTVNSTGIASVTSITSPARGARLRIVDGRIYTSYGHVIEWLTGTLAGTFPLGDRYTSDCPFVLDIPNRKAFYVARTFSGLRVEAFDTQTFVLIGTIEFPEIIMNLRT